MCPVSIVAPSENAEVIKYTSVSGFVFLRFFAPAILNPKLFGLRPENPVSGYLQLAH